MLQAGPIDKNFSFYRSDAILFFQRITLAAVTTGSIRVKMEAAGCNNPEATRAAWIRVAGLAGRVQQITSPGWMHETSART